MIGEWDRKGLESLLEYMERAPVSEERLEVREDALVVYRGNYHPGLGTDHRLVTGLGFLAMMVPHVLLRYQVTSRCYGAVSTRIRRRYGWIGKGGGGAPEGAAVDAISGMAAGIATAGIDEGESGFVRVRRRNWARLIARTYLEDPEVCPRCGKRMRVLAALSSPAQDAVIERILKCRGEWDPPAQGTGPAGACAAAAGGCAAGNSGNRLGAGRSGAGGLGPGSKQGRRAHDPGRQGRHRSRARSRSSRARVHRRA